jgi:hypothetical protein
MVTVEVRMATQVEDFVVGSLIRVRNRDWVVLPSDENIINLRPLSGSEAEVCTVHRILEGHQVQFASTRFSEEDNRG